MNELFEEKYGIVGHITSLKPLRQENLPDEWERKALKAFEKGQKELLEFTSINGEPFVRVMQPMQTTKGCLKCHASQGYKVGDIRGGVSVSVPMRDFIAHEHKEIREQFTSHGLLLILGLIGLSFASGRFKKYLLEKEIASKELERLSTAIKQSADTIVVTDVSGNIVYANPAFEQISGYTCKEAIGKNPRVLKSGKHNRVFYKSLWNTIAGGRTWEGNIINKKKDGTLFEERATISPVLDIEGEIINYVAVKRDVTAERNFERAKAFFTAATSHELRTPLTQLKLLQMLSDDLAEKYQDDEKTAKSKILVGEIYSSVDRIVSATSLHSDLISEVKVSFYPIMIKSFLEVQIESAKHDAKEEGRNIEIDTDLSNLPQKSTTMGSQEMIEKAFVETLSNAIKYTQEGDKVSVKGEVINEEIIIEFFNEGEPIPKEMIEMLFTSYYSEENIFKHSTGKYKHKGGGIGLGLTLTKMIVEYHGGNIILESSIERKGTCLTIKLPLVT